MSLIDDVRVALQKLSEDGEVYAVSEGYRASDEGVSQPPTEQPRVIMIDVIPRNGDLEACKRRVADALKETGLDHVDYTVRLRHPRT
jgi:hypothetical protein